MPSAPRTIDHYIADFPPDVRAILKKIRATIRKAAPGAQESISYRIAAFKLDGKPLVYYAAWKRHTSLYPITAAIRRAHANELEAYETSKGTVRFPLARPVPASLVARLVKARIREVRARDKS